MERTPARRLDFLDALRGLAVLAVLADHLARHAWWPGFAAFSDRYCELAQFGVMLFFLISGYIIPVSLDRHRSLRAFWIGRAFRLYPLYWASIALALAVGASAVGRSPLLVLANLTMLQRWLGLPELLLSYWTLAYELAFYALISVLFALGLRHRAGFLSGGLLVPALVALLVLPLDRAHAAQVATPLFAFATLFAGMAIHRSLHGLSGWRSLIGIGALVPASIATLARLAPAGGPPGDLRNRAAAWALAYATFGLALVLRRRPCPRALTGLGTISYSVYLLHLPILAVLPSRPLTAPLACAAICAVLACSVASYRWIERPGIALGRRLVARRAAPRPTAPGLPQPTK